ncbi:hypothetical protein [Rhodococcus sp. CH91]|uniref:hypothetical protein n=1 Tax=Rhodococcus sp. CH91 TaxID=2910256 RepID=UPI001F4A1079|nr:hypothetical protein [Rhodococcus sp. CH91]
MTVKSVAARAASVTFLATAVHLLVPGSFAHSSPPAAENAAAAATVTALAEEDTSGAVSSFPGDFTTVMGYSPIVESRAGSTSVLADPDGDCSALVPLPDSFESACRVHDLGYDLLRYARTTGGELGSGARRDLDALFARHLETACRPEPDVAACLRMAGVASAAVEFNSWRQGHRSPVAESPWPPALVAGSALLVFTARKVRR